MKTKISAVLLAFAFLSASAFADSTCKEMASKDFSITGDSMFDALKKGCKEIGDNPSFKEWLSDSKSALSVSDRYLSYVKNEVFPRLKKAKYSDLNPDEFGALGFGTGFSELVEKEHCAKDKSALTCSSLNPKKIQSEFIAIAENAEKEHKASASSATNPCDQQPANTPACEADLIKKMKGVSNIHDWKSTDSILGHFWRLNQIADGYVLFKFTGNDLIASMPLTFLVAVRQSTIKNEVHPDMALLDTVDCLKYKGDKTVKNLQGFNVKVKLYDAVQCPK